MRFHVPAAAVLAALFLGASGGSASAQSATRTPLTLPAVKVVRLPDFTGYPSEASFLHRRLPAQTAVRRQVGGEAILQGDPQTLQREREALARARSAQSDRTRALHGEGMDATPHGRIAP
jgi:hypothetical protein